MLVQQPKKQRESCNSNDKPYLATGLEIKIKTAKRQDHNNQSKRAEQAIAFIDF
jgi:hypothetical protein